LGRQAEGLQLREKTLALQKVRLGPDHVDTLGSMMNLSSSYADAGRHAEALELCEEATALWKAKFGPDFPETMRSRYNLGNRYADVGRHADALRVREETLARQKASLGARHPDSLRSMKAVALSLVKLDRGADAVSMIDECVRGAAGQADLGGLVQDVMSLRLRLFEKSRDAVGCRTTAELWEKLGRVDAGSLYDAACNRAVTASVIHAGGKTGDAAEQFTVETDRAMGWLRQAVTAGFRNVTHMKEDKDLEALRGREDFKKLLAELEKKK